jgi:hypothetical protein
VKILPITSQQKSEQRTQIVILHKGTPKGQEIEAKILDQATHWWFTSIILATQEAEIRRITVQSQLGQIVRKTQS